MAERYCGRDVHVVVSRDVRRVRVVRAGERRVGARTIDVRGSDVAPPQRQVQSGPGRAPGRIQHMAPLRQRCSAGRTPEAGAVIVDTRDRGQREAVRVRARQVQGQPAHVTHGQVVVAFEVDTLGLHLADVLERHRDEFSGVEPQRTAGAAMDIGARDRVVVHRAVGDHRVRGQRGDRLFDLDVKGVNRDRQPLHEVRLPYATDRERISRLRLERAWYPTPGC